MGNSQFFLTGNIKYKNIALYFEALWEDNTFYVIRLLPKGKLSKLDNLIIIVLLADMFMFLFLQMKTFRKNLWWSVKLHLKSSSSLHYLNALI